jgi:hypothetical protein
MQANITWNMQDIPESNWRFLDLAYLGTGTLSYWLDDRIRLTVKKGNIFPVFS